MFAEGLAAEAARRIVFMSMEDLREREACDAGHMPAALQLEDANMVERATGAPH